MSERGQALTRKIHALGIDESTLLIGFAVAIGAAVGLAVIVFYKLIDLTQYLALSAAGGLPGIGSLSIVVVVVVGLSLTRLLVKYGANDSDGENIPDVTRALVKRGGIIHPFPVAIKTAGAAMAIGVATQLATRWKLALGHTAS